MSQKSSPTEQERLLKAKELIQQKRYEEAQKILKPIAKHPLAQQWLAKLEQASTQTMRRTQAADEFHFPPKQQAAPPAASRTTNELPMPVYSDPKAARKTQGRRVEDLLDPNRPIVRLPEGEPFDPTSAAMYTPGRILPSFGFGLAGIAIFNFLYLVFGYGFKLGYNWRRLGKSGWSTISIILNILFTIGGVAGLVILIYAIFTKAHLSFATISAINNTQSVLLSTGFLGVLCGANFALLAMQVYLQKEAYTWWELERDPEKLLNHRYDLDNGCLIGTFILALFIVSGVAFGYYTTRPKFYDTAYFALKTEGYWSKTDADDAEICSEGNCVLVLKTGSPINEVYAFFQRYDREGASLNQVGDGVWRELSASAEFTGEDRYDITIDGKRAMVFEYSYPDELGRTIYALAAYVVFDNHLFQVDIQTYSEARFDNNREKINTLLQQVDLKDQP